MERYAHTCYAHDDEIKWEPTEQEIADGCRCPECGVNLIWDVIAHIHEHLATPVPEPKLVWVPSEILNGTHLWTSATHMPYITFRIVYSTLTEKYTLHIDDYVRRSEPKHRDTLDQAKQAAEDYANDN